MPQRFRAGRACQLQWMWKGSVPMAGGQRISEYLIERLYALGVRHFDTQLKVFEQLTVASTVLNDAQTALREIDRVLAAARRYKRPVYIELPRDMVDVSSSRDHAPADLEQPSDPDTLREALRET